MHNNPAFSKALSSLVHPASLFAMAAIFINDHLVRRFTPSWLTGKISDFAWLLFFPFLAAALIALLTPKRLRRHTDLPFLLAVALVGGLFTLGKLFPAVNQAVLDLFGSLTGTPLSIIVDPSDLIALPMLYLGWRIWQKANPALDLRLSRAWAALPLAALLTLGNMAMPDLGVSCLVQSGGQIFTSAYYNSGSGYITTDGGLTWTEGSISGENLCPQQEIAYPQDLLTRSGAIYRYAPEQDILVSTDNGATWATAYSVKPLSEPQQELYDKKGFNGLTSTGPIAAIEDPVTGNILFAMGWQGALVRTAKDWLWVPVGKYQPVHPETIDSLFTLLNMRLILAVAAALLVILTAARYFTHTNWWRFWFILAWLAWIAGVVSAMWDGQAYIGIAPMLGIPIGSLFILVLSLQAIFRFIREAPEAIPAISFTAFTAMILFALPYLLWALGVIPQYILALLISVALFLAVLLPSLRRFEKIVENATQEE